MPLNTPSTAIEQEEFAVIKKRTPPPAGPLALRPALELLEMHAELGELRRVLHELAPLQTMAPAPILAVMGSLNSGKSSCVASLLSASGAARVLRGTLGSEATNRFVLWLPAAWDDRATDGPLWRSIQGQLAPAFGSALAFLSEEPAEAHQQYVDADGFDVPLIAFDERLDALCLLDCPDVESGNASRHAADRLRVVEHAAGIIHAVVYVVESAGMRKETLAGLAGLLNDKLANRPKFLAINFLRHSNGPVEKRVRDADVRAMQDMLGASAVFVAYDFEARSNAGRLPVAAAQKLHLPEGYPWFFEADNAPEMNLPDAITPERMLVSHLAGIEGKALWEHALRDKKMELRLQLETLRQAVTLRCEEHRARLRKHRQRLIDFIAAQMTDSAGGLKIPFTSHLLRQLSESLLRTAPVYARPVLMIKGHVGAFRSFVTKHWDVARKIWTTSADPGASLRHEADAARSRLQSQKGRSLFIATDLAHKAREAGLAVDGVAADTWESAWEQVLTAMQEMSDSLDPAALDRITHDIWKAIPVWKKALLGAAGPVIAVGGLIVACLALVDLGVSAVIFTSSTLQLLSFLGLGTAATFVGTSAAVRLDDLLKKNVGVPAYCRAVATACDVFALPRELDGPLVIDFQRVPRTRVSLADYAAHDVRVPMTNAIFAEEMPSGWNKLKKLLEPQ